MNLKKVIYDAFFEQLQENEKIPIVIVQEIRDLFNKNKSFTSTKIKTIIERAVTNGN